MMRKRKRRHERGAAAVEFALILPVLLLLVLGTVEFARVYNVQISLTNAAREGARHMAVHNDPVLARQTAANSAPAVTPAVVPGNVTITPANCTAGMRATVTVNYSVDLLTGFFGTAIPLTGRGVMSCGG